MNYDNPSASNNENPSQRELYHLVAKHWHHELVNADAADEWLMQQASSAPSIVRKLILELKQKSEICHDLLRCRLADLNLGLNETEAFSIIEPTLQPYGLMGKLEELYTTNAMLTGRSEELISTMRKLQDGRTASLLARMRNIQLERHQLYARFFQPGHISFKASIKGFGDN